MALEALADPLSRVRFLPLAMNFATATEVAVNDPYYAPTHQYVKNDVCLGADDGAYIFLGGAADKTSTFAGPDPSLDNNWVSLKPSGANSSAAVVPVVTGAGSPAYTVTSGTLSNLQEGSKWLVNWQCTAASSATPQVATDANDAIKWTLTAAGVGGSVASMTQLPVVDTVAVANDFSGSVVITVGASGTIALTGSTVTAATNSSTLAITGAILSATMVSLS